jgi:hypothetical protein
MPSGVWPVQVSSLPWYRARTGEEFRLPWGQFCGPGKNPVARGPPRSVQRIGTPEVSSEKRPNHFPGRRAICLPHNALPSPTWRPRAAPIPRRAGPLVRADVPPDSRCSSQKFETEEYGGTIAPGCLIAWEPVAKRFAQAVLLRRAEAVSGRVLLRTQRGLAYPCDPLGHLDSFLRPGRKTEIQHVENDSQINQEHGQMNWIGPPCQLIGLERHIQRARDECEPFGPGPCTP